eukprot:COSAG01_NODE_69976_length_260_cov_0.378882_1_plen_46_part_10
MYAVCHVPVVCILGHHLAGRRGAWAATALGVLIVAVLEETQVLYTR